MVIEVTSGDLALKELTGWIRNRIAPLEDSCTADPAVRIA